MRNPAQGFNAFALMEAMRKRVCACRPTPSGDAELRQLLLLLTELVEIGRV